MLWLLSLICKYAKTHKICFSFKLFFEILKNKIENFYLIFVVLGLLKYFMCVYILWFKQFTFKISSYSPTKFQIKTNPEFDIQTKKKKKEEVTLILLKRGGNI